MGKMELKLVSFQEEWLLVPKLPEMEGIGPCVIPTL